MYNIKLVVQAKKAPKYSKTFLKKLTQIRSKKIKYLFQKKKKENQTEL